MCAYKIIENCNFSNVQAEITRNNTIVIDNSANYIVMVRNGMFLWAHVSLIFISKRTVTLSLPIEEW